MLIIATPLKNLKMGAKQSRKKLQRQLDDQQKEMTSLREQLDLQRQLNDQQKEVALLREQQQKDVKPLQEQLDRVMVILADLQANASPDDFNNVRQKEPDHSKKTVTSKDHDVVSREETPELFTNNQGQCGADVTTTPCKRDLFPLISYPNPHPRPGVGAQQADIDTYSATVHVHQNWTPDEFNYIVKDLPDPRDDVVRWCKAIEDLIEMYAPSARELESVFRRTFGLRWAHLRGNFDVNAARNDIVTGQLQNRDGLFDRVKAAFPVRTDWPRIHNTKQLLDESCEAYRNRMEDCFQKHCGVAEDNPAYNDLLKMAVINNLLPSIHNRVMISCIGWEAQTLTEVWGHVQHAERNILSQEDQRKKTLATAQLMFYENHGKPPQREQKQHQKNPHSHRNIRSRKWKERKGGNRDSSDRAAFCHYWASDDYMEKERPIKRKACVIRQHQDPNSEQYATGPVPCNYGPDGNAAASYLQGGPHALPDLLQAARPTPGSKGSMAIWTR